MNLADPELELIDPTPNIHSLFVHFDEVFFFATLIGRALVRWSKRMYSCAGVCSYEGRNGICDIALSEPLLKLRPRKDLIETLLHEMIHAFLFITDKDNDRDGHGPNFQAHMHRINKAAGLNISIYHDFHDEVKLYLKHWWRCNGKCQSMRPYFGVVRRTANRAPGPSERWWLAHKRICGGTFVKIKEPEQVAPKQKPTKANNKNKKTGDITKYINNNNDNTLNKNVNKVSDWNKRIISVPVVTHTNVPPLAPLPKSGNLLRTNSLTRTNSGSVNEKVRDVWKNKQIPSLTPAKSKVPAKSVNELKTNKHQPDSIHEESPPKKIMKIDDYFKATASSILKEVYGTEFLISQSSNSNKLKAVTVKEGSNSNKVGPVDVKEGFVTCPCCNVKVSSKDINRHLDECLNKDIIENLSKEFVPTTPTVNTNVQTKEIKRNLKDIDGYIQEIPSFEVKKDIKNHGKTDQDDKVEATVKKTQTYKDLNMAKKTKRGNEKLTDFNIPKTEKDVNLLNKAGPSTENHVAQTCPCCGIKVYKPIELHLDECLGFFDNNVTIPEEGASAMDTALIGDIDTNLTEPSTSKEDILIQICPCCGDKVDKPIELHLDECLGFFDNNTTIPVEGAATFETILIDDDYDEFDETQTFNATGTKSPCPCCLKMIEVAEMNEHLDECLGS